MRKRNHLPKLSVVWSQMKKEKKEKNRLLHTSTTHGFQRGFVRQEDSSPIPPTPPPPSCSTCLSHKTNIKQTITHTHTPDPETRCRARPSCAPLSRAPLACTSRPRPPCSPGANYFPPRRRCPIPSRCTCVSICSNVT